MRYVWRRPAFLAFTASALLASMLAATGVHEALGHGVATGLLGGRFYAFYVTPFGGEMFGRLPLAGAWREDIVLGAGSLANLVIGPVLWAMAGRVPGLSARLVLLFMGVVNIGTATIYLAVDSLVGMVGGEGGDIFLLAQRLHLPLLPIGLLGLAASVVVLILFCRRAVMEMESHGAGPANGREVVEILAAMVLPWIVAYSAGLAAAWSLISPLFQARLVGTVVTLFLLYAVCAAVTTVRWRGPGAGAGAVPNLRSLWRTTALMTAAVAGILLFFGPTDRTARAMMLQRPGGEAWRGPSMEPLRFRFRLNIAPDLRGEARVIARMLPRSPAPLVQALVASATAAGPDATAAQPMREWMLQFLLSGAARIAELPPVRAGDGWSVGAVVHLKSTGALVEMPVGRFRLALAIPAGARSYLDEVRVDILPGLRVVHAEGFRRESDGLVWTPGDTGEEGSILESLFGVQTLRLAVEFARE